MRPIFYLIAQPVIPDPDPESRKTTSEASGRTHQPKYHCRKTGEKRNFDEFFEEPLYFTTRIESITFTSENWSVLHVVLFSLVLTKKSDFADIYHDWVEYALKKENPYRKGKWSESFAAGSRLFVTDIKGKLGVKAKGREFIDNDGGCELREALRKTGWPPLPRRMTW